MNRRKERVHQWGLTNIDFKTKGDFDAMSTYKPDQKYANFGTMGKAGFKATQLSTFMRSKKKTGMNIAELPDPKTQTTQQFYMSQGKRIKAPTATLNQQNPALEVNRFTDNVWTGDTANFQSDLTTKVKKRVNKLGITNAGKHKIGGKDDIEIAKTDRQASKTAEHERYHRQKGGSVKPNTFSKVESHAIADHETQLVRLDHRQTLEGKVDLKKVRDIRRAIRRRYATRKNPSKLFHAWDQKQQKKIDTDDVMNMVNKMGIKINKNEAHVLLKSADINGDNALDIEEFISLIHSTNDALDVDLTELAPLNNDLNKNNGKKATDVLDKLQKRASNLYENKLYNQMKFFMQKSTTTIARDCLNEDQDVEGEKSYKIDKKKLKTILNHRLKLPEMLKNDTERIDKIVDEYTLDNNPDCVDYKTMLEDLRTFNYNIESSSVAEPLRKVMSPHTESEMSEPQDTGRSMLTILDIQKVPFNKEEEIHNRSNKINRLLKKHFKTPQELTRHLKNNVDVDKNGVIDLNEFQSLVINTLKDDIENSIVGKKDIEGFLSNFVYNKYGYTAVEEVAPRIFASAEDFNRIIDHFSKPKPPPSKVNAGLDIDHEEHVGDKFYQQRIKTLADKIVSKALNASHSKFQCFKAFDVDDDGYISYQDFANKVKDMQIQASNNEIMSVIKSIDAEKNGYIDFRGFMQHFTPNLPEITNESLPYFRNKKLIGSVNGNIVPNKDLLMHQINRSKSTTNQLLGVAKSFKAASDIQMNLKPSTRFSATPQWQNTFTHYHMDPKSSGYISEQHRFKKTGNSLHVKNQFQMEDKARQTQISDGRVNRKRQVFGACDEKAYRNDVHADAFDQSKLNHKAAMVQNYERLCHSRII